MFLEATAKKLSVQHSKQVKVRFIEPETLSIFAFFLQRTKFPAYKVTQYIFSLMERSQVMQQLGVKQNKKSNSLILSTNGSY